MLCQMTYCNVLARVDSKQLDEILAALFVRWEEALNQLQARLAPRFARKEPRQRKLLSLQGLLSSIERKNGWSLAKHAREAWPYGMQRLLVGSIWDTDLVRDDLCHYVVEQLMRRVFPNADTTRRVFRSTNAEPPGRCKIARLACSSRLPPLLVIPF